MNIRNLLPSTTKSGNKLTTDYSKTPLYKKLGLKDGFKCLFVHTPSYYADLFQELPDIEVLESGDTPLDFIHCFYKENQLFQREIQSLIPRLKKTGMIWVAWPKKASNLSTDLHRDIVRPSMLDRGLIDSKVCSIDDDWSAMKFGYRISDR